MLFSPLLIWALATIARVDELTRRQAFYDKKPDHSYFIGCSLGGRMGIKAAELFPEDYDGIVAGAPTVDFNKLQGARAFFYTVTGAADGIIEVPNKCHFDPQALLCKASEVQGCLNEAQVQQLEKIYAPYEFPDGEPIFPRLNPGAEKRAVDRLLSGLPFTNSVEWFRYVVLSNPAWQPEDYTSALVRTAEAIKPFNIRTYPRTLPGFRARGGKLITYHGGQDQQLTQFGTERFVERMARGDGRLGDYNRYFPILGMFHCNAGPGAWVLDQGGNAAAAGIGFDAESNVLAAAVAWFVDDAPAKGIDFQRDHCAWPRQQTFLGGDYKKPESWSRSPPPGSRRISWTARRTKGSSTTMKMIVTGASGFVGSEIIRQCLQNPKMTTVVAVARRPVSVPDDTPASKFRSVVVSNYDNYPEDAWKEFSGADACIWTVAVTPAKTKGMTPEDVRKACHDYTLAGLQAIWSSEPPRPFRFLYMSGAVAERNQSKQLPWVMAEYRLMRGETENQVLRFADQHEGLEACVARPGFITSCSTALGSAAAAALSVAVVVPNIAVETIAAALVHQAVAGFEQETLRTSDLKRLGRAAGKICMM
ncbi:hypothetical protein VDGE_08954 [Verticillium dahliae]|uniref:Carboxylic ester hydrolase n=1 Tax=Verticillium dahliae TaxID=27337 RepID=A0A444S593_VERDA|nr:hypothetical protein VDGE_08954 [Verticillium dahliae]